MIDPPSVQYPPSAFERECSPIRATQAFQVHLIRDDRTAIELSLSGVLGWDTGLKESDAWLLEIRGPDTLPFHRLA
jgi:hypothetical protein